MNKYTKIETIFERDTEGTKKLIEGKFRNETVEYLKDNQWICTEKIDGCFRSNTKIKTEDGSYLTIGEIVENDMRPTVLGMNDFGEIIPTQVIAVHKNGITDNWLRIKFSRRGNGNKGNYFGTIICTPNHKIYSSGEYKEADSLKIGDKILFLHEYTKLTYVQEQVITGLLVGDGSLGKNSVEFSHKKEHLGYVEYMLKLCGQIAGNMQKERVSGYGTAIIPARTISNSSISDFAKVFYKDGKKIIPKNTIISPLALAIIYMDDGSLQKTDTQQDRCMIALNDYDFESVRNFIEILEAQHGIKAEIQESKGYSLRLNYHEAEKFQFLVAPYICDCMQYKLSGRYQGRNINIEDINKNKTENVFCENEIIEIESIQEKHWRYDLTTETHNYFADNILVHNCNIGIVWDGHKVSYQGRTERAQIPAHLMNKLLEMFGGTVNEELFEQKFGEMQVILFGEGYGAKIQKGGGNYRSDVSFILFDVYLPEQNLWMKRDAIEDIAKTFGIDVVPIILEGTLSQAVDFIKGKPKSTIGVADMEGVVCKPKVDMLDRMGRRLIVKIKVCDFE